jgi:hypothetical protein
MVEPGFLCFDNACFGVLEEGLEKKSSGSRGNRGLLNRRKR